MKRSLLAMAAVAACLATFSNAHAQNSSPYWSLAGNSNATTSSKLGTTTTVPLRLITNNTTRLFISQSAGQVGIGTTSPKSKLAVFNGTTQPAAVWVTSAGKPVYTAFGETTSGTGDHIFAMAAGNASIRPVLIGRRSRGTLAAPTAVVLNDNLTSLLASGYDGSAFQNAASMDFIVDGTPAAGKVPTGIAFYTGSNTATRAERLRIASNGIVSVGGPTLYPSTARLQIKVNNENPDVRGIYVESIDEEFRYGVGIGVDSKGAIGVRGAGGTGVYGTGSKDGDPAVGVYGYAYGSGSFGVQGDAPDGFGVMATGSGGLYAQGLDQDRPAIVANGNYFGVRSAAGIRGVEGRATISDGYGGFFTAAGTALYAAAGTEPGSYAAVFSGNVYASGTFQPSDETLKQNVSAVDGALGLINKLKPRHYEYKKDGKLAALNLPTGAHYGLMAQDVEKLLPGLVKEVRQELTLPKDDDFKKMEPGKPLAKIEAPKRETMTIKSINYTELIPIIIKGMQEQQAENAQLRKELDDLKQLVSKLLNGQGAGTLSLGSLEQNSPNPAGSSTIIRYNIPDAAASARIDVTNAKGQVVKTMSITSRGMGQVTINSAALAAGVYNYSLYIDGRPSDTKRLVISR